MPSSSSHATPAPPPGVAGSDVPFGANELRLNARQWLVSLALVLGITLVTPRLWPRLERLRPGPDYRIPYELSNDYWLYGQRLRRDAGDGRIFVVGDSVVWGEYVLPDGTWSHFLNVESGATNRFVNAGVNGFFPLALEGLLRYHGGALRQQKVILHCNLLWMTSPKADLSTDKEEPFNHATLVPQFVPRIPCYRASAEERLSAVVNRESDGMAWVSHLQNAYFGQQSIPKWTLEEIEGDPPRHPNAWRDPLARITLTLPASSRNDAERGPGSARHKPWSASGRGNTQFDWVPLDSSLQWQAFQRVVRLLRDRGNDVFVILGPFNEHLMAEDNRPAYRTRRDQAAAWLRQNQIPHLVPDTLPSELYADASHPLTEGYARLAKQVCQDEMFRQWLGLR